MPASKARGRIFFGLAFNIFQIIFAQFAQARLRLDVQSTSYILVYVGLLAALVQGLAIRRLTVRLPLEGPAWA